MKRYIAILLVALTLSATFPGLALGSESTATVEPIGSEVASSTPAPVPAPLPVVEMPEAAVESPTPPPAEPTGGPPPATEPTKSVEPSGSVEPTPTPEPEEPSRQDWWLEPSYESSRAADAPVDPEWVIWRIEVKGDFGPSNGAGMNAHWELYEGTEGDGRSYVDVPVPGVYEFRTPGHDRLNLVQFGLGAEPGEKFDVKLTLLGVEFGPDLHEAPTPEQAVTATPVASNPPDPKPDPDSEQEPFLPFTGGELWLLLQLIAGSATTGYFLKRV